VSASSLSQLRSRGGRASRGLVAAAQARRPERGALSTRDTARRLLVSLWIASLFVEYGVTAGPATNVRLADVATLGLIAAAFLVRRTPLAVPRPALALALMAAYALLVVPLAFDPALAVLGAIQLAQFAVIVTALARVLSSVPAGERSGYATLFVALAAVQAILAVGQSVTGSGPIGDPTRGVGTLSLLVALYLAVAFVYVFWRILATAGRRRVAWGAVLVVLAAGLAASQTRTTWGAVLVAITVLAFVRNRRETVAFAAAGLFALVGFGAVLGEFSDRLPEYGVLSRAASLVALAKGDTEGAGNWTLGARAIAWDVSVDTAKEHPLGVGLKNFRLVLPYESFERLPYELKWAANILGPHNQYLFTLAELGWPGLVLLGLLIVTAVSAAARAPASARPLGFALAALVLVQALLADVLFGLPGMLVAGLIAAAVAAQQLARTPVAAPARAARLSGVVVHGRPRD
jgi:O-antigen ligase